MTDEEKKGVEITAPDFNQFYTVLKGYVEFCIQKPKTKLTDKEKEGLEQKEITSKEYELRDAAQKHEDEKKCFQKTYDALCEEISKKGIPYLTVYVEALKKLYTDKSDWKRDIKALLVQGKSLKLFREARSSIMDLYPVLVTVNNAFPVDDYVELSLSPKAALYGSEVDKTQKNSTKRAPMKNKEYKAMLTLFQELNDYKRLGEWLMAILVFVPDQMVDCFQEEYLPERKSLKEWAYKQINGNEIYKKAIVEKLLKNPMLSVLVDAFAAKPGMEKKLADLENKIEQLHEANEHEKTQHEEQRTKQYEIIQQKDAENTVLRTRVKDFERCSQQLSSYMERYQTQVSINERITSENDRRIQEMKTAISTLQSELNEVKDQYDQLQTAHVALQSDYSLRSNELQRLKKMADQKEETARIEMMRELVAGLNEQFFYLTMFYLELKDTGKLEPESIELYADTLSNIDGVLDKMGIKKIGVIDQTVYYDTSIHAAQDAQLSNGDKVVVSGYGWKIGDEVYIKVPVEKGAQ